MRLRKSENRKELVEEVLWVTVRDRAQGSVSGLFQVSCDGLFGGLEPLEELGMKSTHHFLPLVSFLAPYFYFGTYPEPSLPTPGPLPTGTFGLIWVF